MPEANLLLPTYRFGGGGQDYTLTASVIGLQLPQVIPLGADPYPCAEAQPLRLYDRSPLLAQIRFRVCLNR